MYCYCSNFYGPMNCRNRVFLFGDRCDICRSSNTGSSTNYALKFSTPLQWGEIPDNESESEPYHCASDGQSSSSSASSDREGHKAKSH
ncbi:hypothetical protein F4861DRAFT_537678 [Xylaria intraflava]|nr:hypothetical protein F4861DRAFT_537678 [Xylaria intraflava]